MVEKRECPSCKKNGYIVEIIDSRDKHWNTNLICAKCCSKANNCSICRESWQRWESGR